MKIIVGALQAVDHFARLVLCRETWIADATRLGVDCVFLIGAGADRAIDRPIRSGDLLLLPCPNEYRTLPQRTRWFCRWALEGGEGWGAGDGARWNYLFKCDSDTYVSVPRLVACCERLAAGPASPGAVGSRLSPAPSDYIGAEWKPGVGYASGGGGYLLSRKAAAIVAQKLDPPTGAEDLLVGQVLRHNGIRFEIDRRFAPFGSMEQRPRPDNDLITAHKVGADVWRRCQQELGAAH
jgi:hypothetical protein